MSKWLESEFREFLRARLMNDPSDARQTKQIARLAGIMGMSPFTLYDILNGRNDLGFDRLPWLVNALGVIAPKSNTPRAILTWLVSRCQGFALIELKETETDGKIDGEVDNLMVAVGALFAEKVKAYRDGELTDEELDTIYDAGVEVSSCFIALLNEIKAIKAKRGKPC